MGEDNDQSNSDVRPELLGSADRSGPSPAPVDAVEAAKTPVQKVRWYIFECVTCSVVFDVRTPKRLDIVKCPICSIQCKERGSWSANPYNVWLGLSSSLNPQDRGCVNNALRDCGLTAVDFMPWDQRERATYLVKRNVMPTARDLVSFYSLTPQPVIDLDDTDEARDDDWDRT